MFSFSAAGLPHKLAPAPHRYKVRASRAALSLPRPGHTPPPAPTTRPLLPGGLPTPGPLSASPRLTSPQRRGSSAKWRCRSAQRRGGGSDSSCAPSLSPAAAAATTATPPSPGRKWRPAALHGRRKGRGQLPGGAAAPAPGPGPRHSALREHPGPGPPLPACPAAPVLPRASPTRPQGPEESLTADWGFVGLRAASHPSAPSLTPPPPSPGIQAAQQAMARWARFWE